MPGVLGEIWRVPFFGGILNGESQDVEFGTLTVTASINMGMGVLIECTYDIVENHVPLPDGSSRMILCAVWNGAILREHLEQYRDYLHLHLAG